MWKLNASERSARWREFRKSLATLNLDQAVAQVADFWTSCPFTPYYLDPDEPGAWPDPWTLIEENCYCDVARALAMLYTIKLTTHAPIVEFRIYYDPECRVYYNLAWIADGKYVLNMSEGEVVNKAQIESAWRLKSQYNEEQLKLNSY